MAFNYAISDIHGYLQPLEEALSLIDLESDNKNKLILLGDYIDYGSNSCQTLYKLKEMAGKYPDQIIALMGNHEYMFLEFLNAKSNDIWNVEWLGSDKDFATVNSFISISTKDKISQLKTGESYHNYLFRISKIIKEDILTNHEELVRWLKGFPLYYETETQIFVHAGIDEEAEEYWKVGTSDEYFLSKFPATFGKFYKDIIAGHISTSSLARDKEFHNVYWDGESHFYIDGETNTSGVIPVLKYNTITSKYSSFAKKASYDGSVKWKEYLIK
jgi:serine/threonine protein phosphatase 1